MATSGTQRVTQSDDYQVDFLSAVQAIRWPAPPKPDGAMALALLFQLEQSQWWSAERLRRRQFDQLTEVVGHAARTVPFHAQRLADAGISAVRDDLESHWSRLPILTRHDVQSLGEALCSKDLPPAHGPTRMHVTGGSTGEPVRVWGTAVTALAWRVFTLREHLWHRRDFRSTLAAMRFVDHEAARPPQGARSRNWGPATEGLIATGPCAILTIHSSTAEQADWLQRQQPGYLLSYPSALNALARYCLKNNIRLPSLQQIRTFGEVLEPETRVACREAWGVPVVDVYSSEEFGYLAMQCPDHEHYHVQSENVLVEVLDDGGRSCAAGEIGRVVVTSLHNFGMPLLRYDIGDYAEVGPPCDCGRGLPVLRRILGRQRNMFVLPDGQTRWPMFDASALASVFQELPPIRQFQITQRTTTEIDVNLVSARPLTGEEEEHIRHYLQRGLGYAFAVAFCYVDESPRTRRGKFEEFRSQVPLPR